jgi:hypothetical protein
VVLFQREPAPARGRRQIERALGHAGERERLRQKRRRQAAHRDGLRKTQRVHPEQIARRLERAEQSLDLSNFLQSLLARRPQSGLALAEKHQLEAHPHRISGQLNRSFHKNIVR